jgi:hypothetical protein
MTPEELMLDEFGWFLVLKEERKQFAHCWPGFNKLDEVNLASGMGLKGYEPADAGWRVYLGLTLQLISSKNDRIKELESFYREWQEMVSK